MSFLPSLASQTQVPVSSCPWQSISATRRYFASASPDRPQTQRTPGRDIPADVKVLPGPGVNILSHRQPTETHHFPPPTFSLAHRLRPRQHTPPLLSFAKFLADHCARTRKRHALGRKLVLLESKYPCTSTCHAQRQLIATHSIPPLCPRLTSAPSATLRPNGYLSFRPHTPLSNLNQC